MFTPTTAQHAHMRLLDDAEAWHLMPATLRDGTSVALIVVQTGDEDELGQVRCVPIAILATHDVSDALGVTPDPSMVNSVDTVLGTLDDARNGTGQVLATRHLG